MGQVEYPLDTEGADFINPSLDNEMSLCLKMWRVHENHAEMHRDQAFHENKLEVYKAKHRDQVIRERIKLFDRELDRIMIEAYFSLFGERNLTVDISMVLCHQPLDIDEPEI